MTSTHSSGAATRYIEPDAMTRRVANPVMSRLVKMGIGLRGGRLLHVTRRTSGGTQTVPVNPLPLDGERYLVSPRGQTQWVRNIRAAGSAELSKGRRSETIAVAEVDDADKAPIIRAYLDLWSAETGKFFDGLTADSTDAEIDAVAPGFPAFRVVAP